MKKGNPTEADIRQNKAHAAAGALRRINPHILVAPLALDVMGEVGTAFFDAFDVVIGAADTREARLAINRACWKIRRSFIADALDGHTRVVRGGNRRDALDNLRLGRRDSLNAATRRDCVGVCVVCELGP